MTYPGIGGCENTLSLLVASWTFSGDKGALGSLVASVCEARETHRAGEAGGPDGGHPNLECCLDGKHKTKNRRPLYYPVLVNFTVHRDYVGILVTVQIQKVRDGAWESAFLTSFPRMLSCWSTDHILNSSSSIQTAY